MKKLFFGMAFFFLSFHLFSQNSGLGFNYQAVIRGNDGFVFSSKKVELYFSLFAGQHAQNATWREKHELLTDEFGTVNIKIGHGERIEGKVENFSDINFSEIYYWLKTEILESSGLREISFTQLPSVPYAEASYNSHAIIPAGIIMSFAGEEDKIPEGWLLCDGRELDRSAYPELFRAIGVAWGHGNNSTTFNIPDMLGLTERCVSKNSQRDPDTESRTALKEGGNSGNQVGSYQEDNFKEHSHTNNVQRGGGGSIDAANTYPVGWTYAASSHRALRSPGFDYTNSNEINKTGGKETRAKNVYVYKIIKY